MSRQQPKNNLRPHADAPAMPLDFFRASFKALTGHRPMTWQERLYNEWRDGDAQSIRPIIDLPTGLGKTAVMAIWLNRAG